MNTLEQKRQPIKRDYCGVPQCKNYKSDDISMFRLPKVVRESRSQLKKWSNALKMGKKMPSRFVICSEHFHQHDMLIPLHNLQRRRLKVGAFPSVKLPQSSVTTKRNKSNRKDRLANKLNRKSFENVIRQDPELIVWEHVLETVGTSEIVEPESESESDNANIKEFVSPILLWNTEKKLNTMTGISRFSVLESLTKFCQEERPNDKCFMSMRDRILLTFYTLKSNSSFAQVAIWFQISDQTAKLYFADTIQLLAKITKKLIYWQAREQNERSYPKCFERFPNVRTVLNCTEIKTETFRCMSCRTCTYSHCRGIHALKFLIGVSPSGLINYISKVTTGKSSNTADFNISDLTTKLEEGDAVFVDKGFKIDDELAKAGIRLHFLYNKFSREEVHLNTEIASVRVYVERRLARIKKFKVLSDKMDIAMIPYIDDIVSVLCGLSNLSHTILADDKLNNLTVNP